MVWRRWLAQLIRNTCHAADVDQSNISALNSRIAISQLLETSTVSALQYVMLCCTSPSHHFIVIFLPFLPFTTCSTHHLHLSFSLLWYAGWLNAYKEGGWLPSWASPGYRNCMVRRPPLSFCTILSCLHCPKRLMSTVLCSLLCPTLPYPTLTTTTSSSAIA